MDELTLVTVDEAKNYCRLKDTGITAGNSETIDEILKDLITRGSSFIVELIGRPYLFAKTITEIRNGNGKSTIFPSVGPINSISSVLVDGVTIPQRVSVFSYGWTFDSDCLYLVGYVFSQGIQNITINWNTGISLTSRKAYMVQQALLELVNIKWQQRKHPDIVSEKSGNMITNQYRLSDLTDSITKTIDLMRDRVPFE